MYRQVVWENIEDFSKVFYDSFLKDEIINSIYYIFFRIEK